MTREAVIYYLRRVESSLRRDRRLVKTFLEQKDLIPIAEVIEKEVRAGQQAWPVLKEAIEQVKDGVLVIAHLGRLKWSPAFMRILNDSRVSFVCCDNPNLWEENVSAQLAWALNRAQHNSQNQRDNKRTGTFDSHTRTTDRRFQKGVEKGARNSAKARTNRANQIYQLLMPEIQQYRDSGKTFEQVAEALNEKGHLTIIGTPFSAPTVYRIMQRAGAV